MIKYNTKTINDWNFDASNIVKVYHNGAVCYYKLEGSPTPTGQTPCYAVVDDITQYSSTEFVDVFDKATKKWYKLNNLNQYERYGVYGEGRDITYYEGKLTIDGGYEYQWNGSEWVNVGEITETTATLPNVPFTVNYNAKNYDASTKTFAKTEGQLANTDVRVNGNGTLTAHDGYVTVSSGSRGIISGYDDYFNRTNSTPNLTIISKQKTEGNNCHLFANRTSSNYNWMYRPYSSELTLHGTYEHGTLAVTTQPVIESVRVYSDRSVTYNNYTDNTSNTVSDFNYGSINGSVALFAGYTDLDGEWFVGDFYWIYMSQNTLTDEQVQEVINYNEGVSISEYPIYYAEMQDPPKELAFDTMEEALEYQCPYLGVVATIGGVKYKFTYDEQSDTYQWSEINQYFQVNLNSQWVDGTNSYGSISDIENYDFYRSASNYHVTNGKATMFITIYGYTSFTFKVRNYSESSYDFVVVNNIDDTTIPKWRPNEGSGTASSGKVYYSNQSKSSSTTWHDVTFNNLDGGEHYITVTYGKDGSGNSYDDRGYVAIPKGQ